MTLIDYEDNVCGEFDLVTNIGHKRKWDNVSSSGGSDWWPKQVTTVSVGRGRGEESSVGSRVGDGKGRVTVISLVIRVTFEEIVLSGSGASIKTLSVMAILNELGWLAVTC